MDIEKDEATAIHNTTKPVRSGWAKASKKVASEGDDELVWPEFANGKDDQLMW